ncbi:MAG: hypothetical protein JOY58_02530 [Solirubrobacterales bacterium]|nr:hypothetical protein [Solirubrobacterales bacterium]MBV9047114.1 hypothetical protein [Solirubrobacterales bacterium]
MDLTEGEPADPRPRCSRCGDIIGSYEPLVHVSGGSARETSRAAEPHLLGAGGELFHRDCYDPDRTGPGT